VAELEAVRDRFEAANAFAGALRMRLGAIERMRTLLTTAAGAMNVLHQPSDTLAQGYLRLLACEGLALPLPPGAPVPAAEPVEPFALDVDHVNALAPGWSGLDVAPLSDARRTQQGLGAGAVEVQDVALDSPGEAAGLRAGDVVIGPPGAAFSDANELARWTALAPIGVRRELEIQRASARLRVALAMAVAPARAHIPSARLRHPLPPFEGRAVRGDLPDLGKGTRYLLFFWDSQCAPCEEAIPDVMALAQATRSVPVAISDERPARLQAFVARRSGSFPHTVISDPQRRNHQHLAVRGWPTFALVEDGRVTGYAVGFATGGGLVLEAP
jgi:hypothetical protein